jgi:hypothetical protein
MTLPSVLLVPGAWHTPEHLRLLVDELSGHVALPISLPTRDAGTAHTSFAYIHPTGTKLFNNCVAKELRERKNHGRYR